MQTYARANKLPLDVMRFMTEVTSKTVEQVTEPAAVGCYIHGLVLEGARWVGSGAAGGVAVASLCPSECNATC
jgi:dynein heavy chain